MGYVIVICKKTSLPISKFLLALPHPYYLLKTSSDNQQSAKVAQFPSDLKSMSLSYVVNCIVS